VSTGLSSGERRDRSRQTDGIDLIIVSDEEKAGGIGDDRLGAETRRVGSDQAGGEIDGADCGRCRCPR